MMMDSVNTDAEETRAAPRLFLNEIARQRTIEVIEISFICLGFLLLLTALPRRFFSDGNVRFQAINDLLGHGIVSNTSYSLVGPLFSAPLWAVDMLLKSTYWQQRYNVVLCAVVFLVVYIVLRKRMDVSILRKFFLIFITTSIFPNQSTFFGGETFTALFVGMGTLFTLLGVEVSGWIAVILGVVNTPASILGLGLLIIRYIWQKKRLRYGLLCVAGAGLIGTEAWLRRGSPFNSGYGNQPFNTPFVIGLVSILFSFGKGIFFFAPGLLLPIKKSLFKEKGPNQEQLYTTYILWLYFLAGLVLIYSAWWDWSGDWFWGPRFFLFASIPASFALAVRLRNPSGNFFANLLTLLTFAYSVWVGINGAVFDTGNLGDLCQVNKYAQIAQCEFVPTNSVLWHPFTVQSVISHNEKIYMLYCLGIFLYLVAPLLIAMGRQAVKHIQEMRTDVLELKSWHI